MAEFLEAIKTTLKHEGGYANVKGDRGGETYRGISRVFHPEWAGWAIIDKLKPIKHNAIVSNTDLESNVRSFYYKKYWQPIKGDLIDSQRIATFLLDYYIHSGVRAIKRLQSIVGVSQDGIIGNKTIAAINTMNEDILFKAYKNERIAFLTALSKQDGQSKFLKGWLNRVNSFV